MRTLFRLRFALALIAALMAMDIVLTHTRPVEQSELFDRNDYEKTTLAHGGGVEYQRVLFGNSVIISAFIEGESDSGYVNFGIDYGTARDLLQMLEKGYLKPGSDVVIALNYFVLLDTLETNPTYPWHRRAAEPYMYFQRDRLRQLLDAAADRMAFGVVIPRHTGLDKTVYYGQMTDAELDERVSTHGQLFWGLDASSYAGNIAALGAIADWCAGAGVRLRAVWMPFNPYIAMPDNPARVRELADAVLASRGVEILDMESALPRDCFHDLGHLNYEHGARVFTGEIDRWLNS
jgi:hypothetical protein